jgi:S1-C subfamily serine protease
MRRAATLVALQLALFGACQSASAQPALEIDKSFGKVRGWAIGFSEKLGGCLASATYVDETTLWIGFGGKNGTEAYLALTSPKWKSIQPGQRYELRVRTVGQGNWHGSFVGVERSSEKGVFTRNLKEKFILDLAGAGSVQFLLGRERVAQLSMAGSAAALESVLECQKTYVASKAPDPAPRSREGAGRAKAASSSGTGFFVSSDGHVLTNHHVIEGCSDIRVASPGGVSRKAILVAKDSKNDLAALRTDMNPSSVATFSTRARIGDSAFVYGFPLAGLLATSGNFTVGNVTATAGLEDDSRMFQISAPVQPGNSGGPLLDQYGNVIGVIVSKLNALKYAMERNDVPQNVNFAIKTAVAVNFLESNGIALTDERKTSAIEPAEVAERAKAFTVRVVCE